MILTATALNTGPLTLTIVVLEHDAVTALWRRDGDDAKSWEFALTDDVGTEYKPRHSMSGGFADRVMFGDAGFIPGPPDNATRFTLTVRGESSNTLARE